MITFESDKLRSEYVYITKITTSYVYVACALVDGVKQEYQGGVTGKHFDHNIKKVKIHDSVYRRYIQNNVAKLFSEPRLATLNFYGDTIISLEIQRYDYMNKCYESSDTWRSVFDRSIDKVTARIDKAVADGYQVWINGESVFWLNQNDQENYMIMNKEGTLRLYQSHAIQLFKIGADKNIIIEKMVESNNEDESVSDTIIEEGKNNDNVVVAIRRGKMLGYVPNPEAPVEDQIVALSPLLESRKVLNQAGKMRKVNLEEKAAYSIGSPENPAYPNVEFVLQAALTIGKLYGNEAIDFLSIPKILRQLKVVNLRDVSEKTRKNMPIDKTALSCLAWVLGYIHRETDLYKMRELNRTFRFILNSGIIKHNDINLDGILEEGDIKRDIPLRSERLNQTLAVFHDDSLLANPFENMNKLLDAGKLNMAELHGMAEQVNGSRMGWRAENDYGYEATY